MGQGFPVSVVSFGPDDDAQSRLILEVGLHHRHQIKRNVGDDDLLVKMFNLLISPIRTFFIAFFLRSRNFFHGFISDVSPASRPNLLSTIESIYCSCSFSGTS